MEDSDQSPLKQFPGILNKANVDLAVHPLLLMNDVLVRSQFVHPLIDFVPIGIESLYVFDVLRNDTAGP